MDLNTTVETASGFADAGCPAASPPPPRIIKRYANRKFYDTDASRYVNLEDIAGMIKGGVEVKILENGTMRDLTFVTLGHVVSAQAKRRSKLCSHTLRDLIRHDSGGKKEEVECPGDGAREHLHAGARLDALLGRAQRESHSVKQMLTAAEAAVRRLPPRVDERVVRAFEVVAGIGKLKRELIRFSRRIDHLHERLRELEGAG